ncbi:MAG: dockerin type I repeat-containing protein [Candidatus Glassbacteria bacterium]
MRKIIIGIAALAVLAALAAVASSAEDGNKGDPSSVSDLKAGSQPALAAIRGIAAGYPGDVGIEQDSAVVFRENFESGAIEDLGQRWNDISNAGFNVLWYVQDSVPGSPGKRSLQMTATKGYDTGGHLWKLLDKGYDQLYARFYVKFAADAPYVHHFVHMGAQYQSPGFPMGGAGSRPDGAVSFSTGMDLGSRETVNPPGAWFFYSYWCEMRSWQTGEGVPDGRPNPYYGNPFGPIVPEQAKRNEWQCVELMIKCNSAPDKHDGEEAYWIDGRLIGRYGPGTITGTWFTDVFRQTGFFNTNPQPFEGFRWRTTNDLKINWFWLLYYLDSVFANDYNPHNPNIPYNDNKAQVKFDDIVLATRYIGPLVANFQPSCDINGDGRANVIDVVQLLLMYIKDPQNKAADYNGDGSCTLADVLALLRDILEGNC